MEQIKRKQSSIDWLEAQLKQGADFNPIDILSYQKAVDNLFQQAKAMRKQELELAFKGGMSLVEGHLWKPIDKFEEFYNETFN